MDLTSARNHIRATRPRLEHAPFRAFAVRYVLTIAPIAVAAWLLGQWQTPAAFVLFALVAGFTQNAFGILTHEGAHYFFHKRKPVNDALADWLVCLPIFNSVARYRDEHFAHHRECCGHTDPYYGLYGPYDRKRQVASGFLQDLTSLTAARAFIRRQQFTPRSAGERIAFAVSVLLVQAAIALGLWALTGVLAAYVFLWVLPLVTIPFAINRVRTFVEHHPGADGEEASRATLPNALEYLLMAPYGYAFHFEHHLMPDVPYYQLSWVHAELGRQGFEFKPEHLAPHGYVRSFWWLFAQLR